MRRAGAQGQNGAPAGAAGRGGGNAMGGGHGVQNPPNNRRGGGANPQRGNGGRGRGGPPPPAVPGAPPQQANRGGGRGGPPQPPAAPIAPPGHQPLPVAARALRDFRDQPQCPICLDNLSTFERDNRDVTQVVIPALAGMNFHYSVEVNPCGHWMCSRCFDGLRVGEGGDIVALRDTIILERCSVCRGGTGYYSPVTDDQRDMISAMAAVAGFGGHIPQPVAMGQAAVNLLPIPLNIQQVAAANNVGIAPGGNAANPLQRLNNAAAAGVILPTAVAGIAHRVLANYAAPLSQVACNGILPARTTLRGDSSNTYHVNGGYVNLIDSATANRHPVMHAQSRAVCKWFVEYVVQLQAMLGGDDLVAIDVGGRPDKLQTFVAGGTRAVGADIRHMCPLIMKEDYDREAATDLFVTPAAGGEPLACRCKIGDASVIDVGGCAVCNPPDKRRIFFLCHVYALKPEQLAMLCRSGDVILAIHSFRGFKGEFAFKQGTQADVVEATWERMGDTVEMDVEGGERYVHSSFNFLHSRRAMDCGPFGAMKWSKVTTVGDYSVGACPMGNTCMGTTIWHLTKCNADEVLPWPDGDFNRINASKVVELCGTKYEFTRDGKVIQIIATGSINDSYTVGWEAFDAVLRTFLAQSPNTALTYARSRAVVTTHIPADKLNLILCAARAFMRPGLTAYGDAVVADRVDSARIEGQLRGTVVPYEFRPALIGSAIGFYASRTPAGCLIGGALGFAVNGHYREICEQGFNAYLLRRNISHATALTIGAAAALLVQNATNATYGAVTKFVSTVDPKIKIDPIVASTDFLGSFRDPLAKSSTWFAANCSWRSLEDNFRLPTGFKHNLSLPPWETIRTWVPDAFWTQWQRFGRPPDVFSWTGLTLTFNELDGWFPSGAAAAHDTAWSRCVKLAHSGSQLALTTTPVRVVTETYTDLSNGTRVILLCAGVVGLSTLMARYTPRSIDRRFRAGYTRARSWLVGSALQNASTYRTPDMLAEMSPFDVCRRAGYIGLRFALHFILPQQAQAIVMGTAIVDSVEPRWLVFNLANITCEEVVKEAFGRYMLHLGWAPCWAHYGFAAYEVIAKAYVSPDALTTPKFWAFVGLAAGMHCSISGYSFATREMIHTAWNLIFLAVPVVGSLIAGRSEIGRKVYDVCEGMYDCALRHGNVLTGQAFLYDFPGWEADSPVVHEIRDDGEFVPGDKLRQVESKPKGMCVIGPLLSPDVRKLPAPVAHTPANEKRSIFKRVLMVTPCLDHSFFNTTFKPLYESVMRELFMDERVQAMPRVEWLSTMPPRRRSMLEQAFRDIDGDPWLTFAHDIGGRKYDPTKRSLFLKVEQTEYDKDGRAIQAGRDTALAVAGPWCMALCKSLRDCGNGERSYKGIRMIYGIGRDKTTCYRLFFRYAEQGERVVMITGDDVLVATGTHVYSIDAKRWDAHTLAEMLGLGNLQWRKMGCPKRAFDNMEQGLDRNGRSTHGHKYKRRGGTASGDPDTIQKNGITGTPIIIMALLEHLRTGEDFSAILTRMAKRVGVVYEFVDEQGIAIGDQANYHRCEFCSCYPIPLLDGTVGACPKLGKVFFRFGLSKLGHPPDVSLRSKALSLMAESRHSSVLTHYAETAYRCVGHGKVHAEERRFTEYATIFDVGPHLDLEDDLLRIRYGFGRDEIKSAVTEIWRDYVDGQVCFTNSVIATIIEVDN